MSDRMNLLKKAIASDGQAVVARRIGYSVSAVNQAMHGKYAGSMDNLLKRVAEIYGNGTVRCPIMGEISLQQCAGERRKEFAATNPQRVKLHIACKQCTAHH